MGPYRACTPSSPVAVGSIEHRLEGSAQPGQKCLLVHWTMHHRHVQRARFPLPPMSGEIVVPRIPFNPKKRCCRDVSVRNSDLLAVCLQDEAAPRMPTARVSSLSIHHFDLKAIIGSTFAIRRTLAPPFTHQDSIFRLLFLFSFTSVPWFSHCHMESTIWSFSMDEEAKDTK
jgi:hypothetical protein